MKGITEFVEGFYVAKKSEMNKEEFVKQVECEFGEKFDIKAVFEGMCRYYPSGCERASAEFEGEPVYLFEDKKNRGVFDVWVVQKGYAGFDEIEIKLG